MSRVEIASQSWGWIADSHGEGQGGASALIKNLDGTNATHWSAITGGSSTTGAITTNADGTIPRYIETGAYTITVNSVTRRVDAVSGYDAAVINEAPLNIKDDRVGAKVDSSTDDSAAWATAVSMMPSTGGEIFHPGGALSSLVTGNFPSLFQKKNITIKGVGGMNDTAGWCSRILLDGAPANRYIDARQSIGVRFEGVQIVYRSASFTGHLLDFGNAAGAGSDTRFCALDNCWLGGNPGTSADNAQSLLFLQNAHSIDAYKTAFMEGQVGVLGRTLNTEFSNRIGFHECLFYNNHVAHIKNADASWVADSCTFQQLKDGTAGMYKHDAGVVAQGLTFRDCWAGDITVASGPQITYSGDCLVIDGGRIGAEHASASFISFDENDCHGIVIGGCNFVGPGGPVLAFGSTTGHTGVLLPCEYDNVSAQTSGTVPTTFLLHETDGYWGHFNIGGNASLGASSAVGIHMDTAGFADHVGAASTSAILRASAPADTNPRLRIAASGEVQLGPGNTGADVTHSRIAANQWGLANGDSLHLGTATDAGGSFLQGWEQTADPAAPAANAGRLFFKDNGAGKTQLVVRFNTGATQVIATEP